MGSPVSPVLADIFMENLEGKVFMEHDQAPRIWKRFVDDILAVVKRNHGYKWLSKLNAAHENITFTMEEETQGTLPFMDVHFFKKWDRKVEKNSVSKTNTYKQICSVSITSTKQCEVG